MIASRKTEPFGSHLIEVKDLSTQQVAVFLFVDVTANEAQTVVADFRRILGGMSRAAVVNWIAA